MAKPLRKVIQKPLQDGPTIEPEGERKFADAHKVEVVGDANGNDDEVFKGSKVKVFDRAKHREGVQPNNNIPTKKIDFKVPDQAWSASHDPNGVLQQEETEEKVDFEELDEDEQNEVLHQTISMINASNPDDEEDGDEELTESHYQFSHHSGEAVQCSSKASDAMSSAMGCKDPKMKEHFTSLASMYKTAAHHHLKLATSYAKQAGIKEEEILDEANWIQGAIKHPGAEKRAAKAAGMSTHAYMEKHKHDSGKSGARARLGLTLSKMNKEETELSEAVPTQPQIPGSKKKNKATSSTGVDNTVAKQVTVDAAPGYQKNWKKDIYMEDNELLSEISWRFKKIYSRSNKERCC